MNSISQNIKNTSVSEISMTGDWTVWEIDINNQDGLQRKSIQVLHAHCPRSPSNQFLCRYHLFYSYLVVWCGVVWCGVVWLFNLNPITGWHTGQLSAQCSFIHYYFSVEAQEPEPAWQLIRRKMTLIEPDLSSFSSFLLLSFSFHLRPGSVLSVGLLHPEWLIIYWVDHWLDVSN